MCTMCWASRAPRKEIQGDGFRISLAERVLGPLSVRRFPANGGRIRTVSHSGSAGKEPW